MISDLKRELTIDGRRISDDDPCYVIAEIGNNHMGKLHIAKKMIRKAKICGADAVKFQKRDNKALLTTELYNQSYDNRNSFGPTYGAHREALEFSWDDYVEMMSFAREIGITFFATPFDLPSADFLMELGVPAFKIASADLDNVPLLRKVAEYGLPTIVSTGGGTMNEVRRAAALFDELNPGNYALLQCTSGYPPKYEELDLGVIPTFRQEFPRTVVGLSSHDTGISAPVAAYTLGARIVEKHFTLDRTWVGTDQAFSLEPTALRDLVAALSATRQALGGEDKRRHRSEEGPLKKLRKKIVAARNLPAGHVLEMDDLEFKCPGNGLSPCKVDQLLGKPLRVSLEAEADVTLDAVDDEKACRSTS